MQHVFEIPWACNKQDTSPEFWRCLGLVHWCIIAFPGFWVNHPFLDTMTHPYSMRVGKCPTN